MKLNEIDNQTLIDELQKRMNRIEGFANDRIIYELRKRESAGLLSDDDYKALLKVIENNEVIEDLKEASYDEGLADGEKTSRKIIDGRTMKQAIEAAFIHADKYNSYAEEIAVIIHKNYDEDNFANLVLAMIPKTNESIVLEQIFNIKIDSRWKLDRLKEFAKSLKHE